MFCHHDVNLFLFLSEQNWTFSRILHKFKHFTQIQNTRRGGESSPAKELGLGGIHHLAEEDGDPVDLVVHDVKEGPVHHHIQRALCVKGEGDDLHEGCGGALGALQVDVDDGLVHHAVHAQQLLGVDRQLAQGALVCKYGFCAQVGEHLFGIELRLGAESRHTQVNLPVTPGRSILNLGEVIGFVDLVSAGLIY